MNGVRARIKADSEGALATAHSGATFTALASNGKLQPFDKYLPKSSKPKQPAQTLDEVMGKWSALASAGYPIKIEGVAHGD